MSVTEQVHKRSRQVKLTSARRVERLLLTISVPLLVPEWCARQKEELAGIDKDAYNYMLTV